MAAGYKRIAPEIKQEILNKVKNEGTKLEELAASYGIHPDTIRNWLKAGITPGSSLAEINRLKRENQQLLLTIGFFAAKQVAAKKGVELGNW
jgi:transposase-like protein